MRPLHGLGILLCLCFGCRSPEPPPIQRGVYHWESRLDLTQEEGQWLNRQQIDRLYLRLFDVDQGLPVGVLYISDSLRSIPPEIVPTFFLTNRSFQNIAESEAESLADRLFRKASLQLARLPGQTVVPEWQFDCDWTESTRTAYFGFLERMRRKLAPEGIGISATIRLHQVKYFDRTGVPPADRGMLMCYNVGDVTDPQTRNSILDPAIVRDYLYNFDTYPLPLDLALPLFRWGVVIREGKMVRLINDLGPEHLLDSSRFLFRDPNHVEVRKSTYLDGYYLYREDLIRLESAPANLLRETAGELSRVMKRPERVVFYHLNPGMIKMYTDEDLEALFDILEKK
jgi:hypothetical protein